MYYNEEQKASNSSQRDYIDPNEPFVQDNPFVPGGILANYKKRQGLNAKDVMEQNYWDNVKHMRDDASQYFDTLTQNEQDVMQNTKNYELRLRMNREVSHTEDFRKRFMTREYGNYEKYEKNTVTEEVERGQDDLGNDPLFKNDREATQRMKTLEGDYLNDREHKRLEDMLTNDQYADQTIEQRIKGQTVFENNPDELQQ